MFEFRLTIDKDFVCTSTKLAIDDGAIHDSEGTVLRRFDVRVITRGARVIQHDGIVGRTAYSADRLGQKTVLPLSTACIGDFEKRHNEPDGEENYSVERRKNLVL